MNMQQRLFAAQLETGAIVGKYFDEVLPEGFWEKTVSGVVKKEKEGENKMTERKIEKMGRIIESVDHPQDLADAVNEKIREGWSPYGTPVDGGDGYLIQFIVKYAPDKERMFKRFSGMRYVEVHISNDPNFLMYRLQEAVAIAARRVHAQADTQGVKGRYVAEPFGNPIEMGGKLVQALAVYRWVPFPESANEKETEPKND